uniref:Uncharacterized protein n=1 Tax=Arundo donax TaxID=35708 RepID=A0A0A9C3B8_ARUDO
MWLTMPLQNENKCRLMSNYTCMLSQIHLVT